jgi:antitoxin component YwqK of YwqJK toxin-antitoxin module
VTLANNKENRLWTEFYKNGREKMQVTLRNGMKEGRYAEWFEDGTPKAEGNYEEGKREGHWYEYGPSGEIVREGKYNADKAEGIWKEWYRNERIRNGVLTESLYAKGLRNGASVQWNAMGQKIAEGNYKNGVLDGVWTYYRDGKPSKVIYENGQYTRQIR